MMHAQLFTLPPLYTDQHARQDKKRLMLQASLEEAKQSIRALKKEKRSPDRTRSLRQQCARLRLTQLQLQLHQMKVLSVTQSTSDESIPTIRT